MELLFWIIGAVGVILFLMWLVSYKTAGGGLKSKITRIQNRSATIMPPIAGDYQTRATQGAVKHTRALVDQAEAVHDLHTVPDKKNREEEKEIVEHKNLVVRTEAATKKELHPEVFNTLQSESGLAEIEISKTRQLKQIDIDAEFQQTLNTLAAISKFTHLQYEQFDEIRGRIMALIEDKHRISTSHLPAEVMAEQLEAVQDALSAYQEVFNGVKNRLLEAGNGEDVSGIGALFADERRLRVGPKADPQNQLSSSKIRGGRKPSDNKGGGT